MDSAFRNFLEHEARALLTRLDRIQPFALSESMVPAANLSAEAQRAIDGFLAQRRGGLRREVLASLDWLLSAADARSPAYAQRRFCVLRMHFNALVTQFDLFADALAQRGERDHGVWLSGLDY